MILMIKTQRGGGKGGSYKSDESIFVYLSAVVVYNNNFLTLFNVVRKV